MKKIVLVLLLTVFAAPSFAQTVINSRAPNPIANGLANSFSNSGPAASQPMRNNDGIRTLADRRQEMIQKQQQQLQKSGINIQNIANPQQNQVMTIQNGIPNQNSSQSMPNQQLQNNADMNGLQRSGNPMPTTGTGTYSR